MLQVTYIGPFFRFFSSHNLSKLFREVHSPLLTKPIQVLNGFRVVYDNDLVSFTGGAIFVNNYLLWETYDTHIKFSDFKLLLAQDYKYWVIAQDAHYRWVQGLEREDNFTQYRQVIILATLTLHKVLYNSPLYTFSKLDLGTIMPVLLIEKFRTKGQNTDTYETNIPYKSDANEFTSLNGILVHNNQDYTFVTDTKIKFNRVIRDDEYIQRASVVIYK